MEISQSIVPLCLRIKGDHHNAQHFAFYLEYIIFHMNPKKVEPALTWCVKNKLVGQKFLDFIANDCRHSALELIRYLTMMLEKEKQMRALYYERDIM